MKIYLYCMETGIYQGEDFADGCSMKKERAEPGSGCTTIAPPEYARGQVPVFIPIEKRWELQVVAAAARAARIQERDGVVGTSCQPAQKEESS